MKSQSKSRRIGLARALSKLGYCSRSSATARIKSGSVRLNGRVRTDPETPVDMTTDRIEVDGAQVVAQTKSYWMLNKPRGVVTTASDEKGRRTVYEFLNDDQRWLAPVGRLDKASEGLLLFTNDSEWASELLAPESHVEKTYHVQVNIVADRAFVDVLLDGVAVNGGEVLRAKKASILRSGEKNTWLEIILDEGKNRQIRRMLAALEAEVIRLVRIGIGQVALGRLGKGQLRQLTAEEKAALDACLTSAKSKANRNAG